jgi:hypothetical protein
VKLTRVVFSLLFLPLLLVMCSCQCFYWDEYDGPYRKYYRVRVTDPRGGLIADYIAEGCVHRNERGYHFHAVERTSQQPYQKTIRYPRGRFIDAAGPNIVVTRCGKPLWLFQMEGY